MYALTLWQPWAWSITHGPKRVENRDWPFPRSLRGSVIAIHAGQRWDQEGAEFLADLGLAVGTKDDHHLGAVLGVARLVEVVTDSRQIKLDQRRFFFGEFGWVLGDVRALKQPIYCRGMQRLWSLSAAVNLAVTRQIDSH